MILCLQEESEECQNGEIDLADIANGVLSKILDGNPDVTVVIASTEGKCLTSTLKKRQAQEITANVLSFTDKVKILLKKTLNEDLLFVRLRGSNQEIVVTFDEPLEIITIQHDEISQSKMSERR